jgi:hypothetical protein
MSNTSREKRNEIRQIVMADYKHLNNAQKRKVEVLIRRYDHLAMRIANANYNIDYDKAELYALLWVLDYVQTGEMAVLEKASK